MTIYDLFFIVGLAVWLFHTGSYVCGIDFNSKLSALLDTFSIVFIAAGLVGGVLNAFRGK